MGGPGSGAAVGGWLPAWRRARAAYSYDEIQCIGEQAKRYQTGAHGFRKPHAGAMRPHLRDSERQTLRQQGPRKEAGRLLQLAGRVVLLARRESPRRV